MKKTFITILLISFVFNFVNAEEIKQTNKKELSKEDEEFIKKWQQLEQREKEAKNKTGEAKKMGKTLDELNKQLEKDKK
jgi:uncharacterized ion transporter superfamily protein YfcC